VKAFQDVSVGEALPEIAYPINVYRLVMAAGSNRDFNSIHHNSEYAQETGAPEMYANTGFLLGMWERCVRDWAGPAARIRSIKGFSMKSFNVVGDTTVVSAEVIGVEPLADGGLVEIAIQSRNSGGITVGPGTVVVELPSRIPGSRDS